MQLVFKVRQFSVCHFFNNTKPNNMKIQIDTPGLYELKLVKATEQPTPPVIVPEPELNLMPTTHKLMDAHQTGESPFEVFKFDNEWHFMVADRVEQKTYLYRSSSPVQLHDKTECTLRFRGAPIPFVLHNIVVLPDGTAWITVEHDDEIWICGQHGGAKGQFTEFSLAKKVKINGAKDTKHALHFDQRLNKWFIHGRKRGVQDYPNEKNPYKLNRRTVRILQADTPDGSWAEVGAIDPLDYQPHYGNTRFRQDYYSSDIMSFEGYQLSNIGTYFQDEQWKIPHRPERISGTGETYPILASSKDGITWKFHDCIIDLSKHWNSDLKVGQIHCGTMMLDSGKLYLYGFKRPDIHYFEKPNQPKSEHFVCVWENGAEVLRKFIGV